MLPLSEDLTVAWDRLEPSRQRWAATESPPPVLSRKLLLRSTSLPVDPSVELIHQLSSTDLASPCNLWKQVEILKVMLSVWEMGVGGDSIF